MKLIPLSQGEFAIIDDDDYDDASYFKWYCRKYKGTDRKYAITSIWNGKSYFKVYLHNFISGVKHPDHKNNNGLDNRKENLRIATHADNSRNRSMDRKNTSGLKGVSFHKHTKKWRATLSINNRSVSLGFYDDKIHAAKVYDGISMLIFGQFAKTNRQLGLLP